MSDQAFVKAFSRRRPASEPLCTEGDVTEKGSNTEPVAPPLKPDQVINGGNSNDSEFGGLHLDQSVASTDRVWVDHLAEQVSRADYAENGIPRPHLEAASDFQPLSGPPAADNEFSPDVADEKTPVPGVIGEAGAVCPTTQTDDPLNSTEATDLVARIQNAYASTFTDAASFVHGEISNIPPEDVLQGMRQANHGRTADAFPDLRNLDHSAEQQFDVRAAQSVPDQRQDVAASEPIIENPFAEPIQNASAQSPSKDVVEENPTLTPSTSTEDLPGAQSEPIAHDTSLDPLTFLDGQANSQASIIPFQAVWEVDVLDVPTTVADLFFEGTLFQQIAERISEAVESGLNSVIVTSTKAGEGRSSVAVGLAMAAAASGIRVALVDANADQPTLADELGLELQYGWVDTIRAGLPIKEVAVHAVEDGVTLIPLMPPAGKNAATGYEVVQLVELLKDKFELVILDGPTSQSVQIHQCASAVDSAIIVRDMTRTDSVAINEFSYRLRESGVQGVGVVENFT